MAQDTRPAEGPPDLARHDWRLLAHPLFLDQLGRLLAAVERAKRADPEGWRGKADAKLLAAIRALVLERIPRDPLAAEFRQGNTLGPAHRHWFRAKFGGARFRLFFRADSRARVVVYAWVNDRDTLRKAGSGTDPSAVFGAMLVGGTHQTTGQRCWPWPRRQRRCGALGEAEKT